MTRYLARLADLAYRRRGRMVLAWIVADDRDHRRSAPRSPGEYNADYNTPGSESKAASDLTEQRFGGYSRPGDLRRLEGPGRRATARAPAQRVDAFLAAGAEGRPHRSADTPIRVSRDGTIGDDHAAADRPRLGRHEGGRQAADRRRRAQQRRRAPDQARRAIRSTPRRTQSSPEGHRLPRRRDRAADRLRLGGRRRPAARDRPGRPRHLLRRPDRCCSPTSSTSPTGRPRSPGLIGIGVGIDYSLLVLTRFRAALDDGKDRHDAVVEAVTTAGRSVIIAGSTVVIAVLGLFLTGLPYMYGVAHLGLARGAGRDARRGHAAAGAALLPRARRSTGCGSRSSAAGAEDGGQRRVARRALEPRRPAAAVDGGDRRDGGPARAGGAGARHAARLPRRRQRPAEHDDPPGLRPDHRGLRARHQRAAGDRRRAARPRRPRPEIDALRAASCAREPGVAFVAAPRDQPGGRRGDRSP